jgi:hypothetical protein
VANAVAEFRPISKNPVDKANPALREKRGFSTASGFGVDMCDPANSVCPQALALSVRIT